uniref:Uncharacterized protein n=1 Tax=virus sp. ctBS918 TaxID=2825807 RepID=A0A8S5RP31_9VIRU|nr:MAG TPA: hypothetical protein [virus sp. ctBS918]
MPNYIQKEGSSSNESTPSYLQLCTILSRTRTIIL